MKPDLVSIIIPFLNESDNIESLVNELNEIFKNEQSFKTEIIFVDDGSKDGSFSKLRQQKFGNYKVQLIRLSKNYGSHAAVRAGVTKANGDYITFLPADLQDPPTLPAKLYNMISEGHDIVWGFRRTTRSRFFENLFSKFYAFLMKKFVYPDYPDNGFDIVMFNYKVKEQLNLNIESNSSVFLQMFGFGFNSTNIEYDKLERQHGRSKWTFSKKIKLLIDSFVAFSFAPIRFVTITGISFFIVGSLWMIYIILRKIFVGDLASGWPALVSILLIGFGVTNISLGIIAEYLWRTLDASRKRPAFIIDEIIEITP